MWIDLIFPRIYVYHGSYDPNALPVSHVYYTWGVFHKD